MGTRINYLFDGVDGTTATTGNTGAASVTATNGGSSITLESDVGLHGTTGLQIAWGGTSTGGPILSRFGLAAASNTASLSVVLTIPASYPTTQHTVMGIRSSSGTIGSIYRNNAGAFAFQPSSGSPTALLPNASIPGGVTKLRITLTATAASTTTGSWQIKFYRADTDVQIGSTYSASSQNMSANQISQVQLGTTTAEATGIVYGFEDLQVEEGTTTEIGAYIPSIPLDTPVVTIDEINDATTIGGSDGSIEFSWAAVDDADHYEVAIANTEDATTGFTVLDADVSATAYTATGRAKGPFTVRVIAQPA